jgi:uncharacterized membrane protein
MNRDRRKIVASIFADAAKYSLTAGVLGAVVTGVVMGLIAGIFSILAYFVTPKDKE